MRNENSVGPLAAGFLIGGIIGGAAALLAAPQSGEETRDQIRTEGIRIKDRTEHTIDEALNTMRKASEEIEDQIALLQAQQKESLEQSRVQWKQAIDEILAITKEAAAQMKQTTSRPVDRSVEPVDESVHAASL